MKKIILLCLIFPCIMVNASEITEDYFDIASNYCTYGNYKDALTYIEKIISIEPANTNAIEMKNNILRITNPNSKSYLENTNKTIQQAEIYKKQGDNSKELETLINSPNDFWANYFIGNYYLQNDHPVDAITYYKKAITLKPNFAQSYLKISQAYFMNNDYTNTINSLDKYLTFNNNSDIAYALRARTNICINNITEAQNDITKALGIDENLPYLLLEAKILYLKGDYENAREKLNLLSKNIQSSEVYKYLGLCDYALGNYTTALLNLDKAIILSDDDKTLNSTYNEIKTKLENK